MAPGSYPFAEHYEFDVNEAQLIDAVNEFKTNHPEYAAPEYIGPDGRIAPNSHWYHIYFYYKEKEEVVHTWVRSEDDGSTFALVAISEGSLSNKYRMINHDFGFFENRRYKKEFKNRILHEIRTLVEHP
jgi:hypothetical protein